MQQGSIDAEPTLSQHNYVQLFRLVQLAVEHLWQMRESHSKLYPAYNCARTAADRWKADAQAYLQLGGRLLQQLHSSSGALLSEQALSQVADARMALETADAAYNAALDQLERLEINWRLVFGVDMQQLVAKGDVQQLEQLLPQVAYGNILAEDPAGLAPRHCRQLLLLGQACLDYLWAICVETSRVIKAQVQQLAATSAPIPALTTSCEELRASLAAALSSSLELTHAAATAAAPAAGSLRAKMDQLESNLR
ncbi:hypothetical protein COO60DRAFT_1633472 [Scenedesmus sp. NREL 46B-D3]|nr:hypothetical protein COO60DRAFT_1633472 [Scenedesmus sp. NREL 46B-D3]